MLVTCYLYEMLHMRLALQFYHQEVGGVPVLWLIEDQLLLLSFLPLYSPLHYHHHLYDKNKGITNLERHVHIHVCITYALVQKSYTSTFVVIADLLFSEFTIFCD